MYNFTRIKIKVLFYFLNMFLYFFIYIHIGLKLKFSIDYSVVINIILNGISNFYNMLPISYFDMGCSVFNTHYFFSVVPDLVKVVNQYYGIYRYVIETSII